MNDFAMRVYRIKMYRGGVCEYRLYSCGFFIALGEGRGGFLLVILSTVMVIWMEN